MSPTNKLQFNLFMYNISNWKNQVSQDKIVRIQTNK